MLEHAGFTQNDFERSGNPVPTMEGASPSLSSLLEKHDADFVLSRAEWTFAKQKWQRTKNKVRGDAKFETAQILPGWQEKVYA